MRALGTALSSLVMACVFPACAEEGDRPSQVTDLRILAVAAEPPEVLFDRESGFDSPQVVFKALVADPQGGAATFTWRFCPVESEQACMNFRNVRDAAPAPMRAMLDGLFAIAEGGTADPSVDQGVGSFDVAEFPTAWPTDLFNYHLQASGLGLGNGAWPSAVLSLTNARGAEVLAQKRVTLNASDLRQFNPELGAAFGLGVCEAEGGSGGCLPLRPRVANKNPKVADVLVARGERAQLPFEHVEQPMVVKPNEKLRFRPQLTPEAFESYQSVQSALQDSTLRVEEQRERPAVSWYATAGTFAEDITAFEATKTFDNVYTAPAAAPAETGGAVSVWLVVRDLRGGVGWKEMRLVVTP